MDTIEINLFESWKLHYEIYLLNYFNTIILPTIKNHTTKPVYQKNKLYKNFCKLLFSKSSGEISFWI